MNMIVGFLGEYEVHFIRNFLFDAALARKTIFEIFGRIEKKKSKMNKF